MKTIQINVEIEMNNRLFKLYGVLGVAGLCLLLAPGVNAGMKVKKDKAVKIDVCHAPPGKSLNIKPIHIGSKAVRAHLNHGDWLISEEMCDAIADNDCDGAPDPVADDADCAAAIITGATCVAGICEGPDGNTPIATITETILRGGNPPGSDRGVESAAGNLVADAQLWATASNGAEIAFMNPGGVRSDLEYPQSAGEGDGVVTFGEAFTFQPFGNTLLTFPMTGAQIVSVLEEQCQPVGSSRPFLHLGVSDGFTYDLSKTITAGDCVSITISNVKLHGFDLIPGATYLVTVNNFLADGGDNFLTFKTIDPATRIWGGGDLAAITGYLAAFSPVAPPSTDRVNEVP
ncbi:5'-nucleotidase C-terminal domain-containing protein, partial [Pseudomonadota bacterium]